MSKRILAVLAAACLLGGCGGSGTGETRETENSVASLRSAPADGPTTAKPAASGEDRRPLLRLDATTEERDAMFEVWMACVEKEGGVENPKLVLANKDLDPETRRVREACIDKEPETFEERQMRLDITAFKDNQREWYQCAKKEGYQVGPQDPETGRFGLTAIGPEGDYQSPKIEACRLTAFRD